MRQLVLAGLVGRATLAGVSEGATTSDKAARATQAPAKAGYKYLCQKKDKYGCWCTVYVCHRYENAKKWYDKQPNNARIVAQKD